MLTKLYVLLAAGLPGTPKNCVEADQCATTLPGVQGSAVQFRAILEVAFGVFAALAVLVIVIASINLITGGGEPEKISRAKKTIVFALIGLAIALLAESIVYVLLDKF